jgi:hypothetical protein
LHLINQPTELVREVQNRLQQVYGGFVAENFATNAPEMLEGLSWAGSSNRAPP